MWCSQNYYHYPDYADTYYLFLRRAKYVSVSYIRSLPAPLLIDRFMLGQVFFNPTGCRKDLL